MKKYILAYLLNKSRNAAVNNQLLATYQQIKKDTLLKYGTFSGNSRTQKEHLLCGKLLGTFLCKEIKLGGKTFELSYRIEKGKASLHVFQDKPYIKASNFNFAALCLIALHWFTSIELNPLLIQIASVKGTFWSGSKFVQIKPLKVFSWFIKRPKQEALNLEFNDVVFQEKIKPIDSLPF